MKEITKINSFKELNMLLEKFNRIDRQEKLNGKFCNVGKFNSILIFQKGFNIDLFKNICFLELKEEKSELFLFELIYKHLEKNLFDITKIKEIIHSLNNKGFSIQDIEDLRFTLKERKIFLCEQVGLVDFLTKLNELSKEADGLEVVRYELIMENSIKEFKYMDFKDIMTLLTFDKFFDLKDTEAFKIKYKSQNLLLAEKAFKEAQNIFFGK